MNIWRNLILVILRDDMSLFKRKTLQMIGVWFFSYSHKLSGWLVSQSAKLARCEISESLHIRRCISQINAFKSQVKQSACETCANEWFFPLVKHTKTQRWQAEQQQQQIFRINQPWKGRWIKRRISPAMEWMQKSASSLPPNKHN